MGYHLLRMKITATFLLFVFFIFLFYCCVQTSKPETSAVPTYVGTQKCQQCHPKEYAGYLNSDHFHAMDSALPRSVRGDFNNTAFVYHGDTSIFYQQGGKYYVNTTDSAGKKADFQVNFTFGWKPLQQYLVAFPDGRIQALPFCWDTRPKEKGGQRWFHIYGKEKIAPKDELYWTGINQNWNNMCADCHTTNYFKNFDISSNSFHSSWGESKVSCESCHGPASAHLSWLDKRPAADNLKGFSVNLQSRVSRWTFNPSKGIAYPDQPLQNNILIETCGRCHSRASRLSDYYYHGQSLLQTHIPSTINSSNYFIDGQIREEDYEFGSFQQSRMYAMGVTCINCHEPHSMQLKAPGNLVCYSCHAPSTFNTTAHTHHTEKSEGSQCVNCHMPTRTYMVIDDRRDHSIRIPRPDLSQTLGTPNACNQCHSNQSVAWTVTYFAQWYGDKLPKNKTYGQLLHQVAANIAGSEDAMHGLLADPAYPAVIKATAMEQYHQYYSPRILEEAKKYLQSDDPNLRLNALHAMTGLPQEIMLPLVKPLLNDPVVSVRTQAMNTLASQYGQMEGGEKQRFDEVMNEYIGIQRNMGDRPEGYLNQGIVLAATGRANEAEQVYLLGLQRFPQFVAGYANLADLYRAMGNEEKAKAFLEKGLQIQPGNATLHYSLALWHVRNKDNPAALQQLQLAIRLDPADPSFAYAYAIALHSTGASQRGLRILETFLDKQGNSPMIIDGLISISQDLHQSEKANYYQSLRSKIFGY